MDNDKPSPGGFSHKEPYFSVIWSQNYHVAPLCLLSLSPHTHTLFLVSPLSTHTQSLAFSLVLTFLPTYTQVLEFRLGWNFQTFHAFLADILTHEQEISSKVLHSQKVGECVEKGDKGEREEGYDERRRWLCEVRLRLLGLTRLEQILGQIHLTPAAQEASLVSPPSLTCVPRLQGLLQECLE